MTEIELARQTGFDCGYRVAIDDLQVFVKTLIFNCVQLQEQDTRSLLKNILDHSEVLRRRRL